MADGVNLKLPSALEHARITDLPAAAFYIPNFITAEEEQVILHKVRPARYYRH